MRCAAILESAGLRVDDLAEGQIGDAIVLPGMIDLSIRGSKTDTTLAGQAAVLTAAPGAAGDGVRAFLDGTRLGLERLLALPVDTLGVLAARFRADCSPQELGRGAAELDAWPEDIRALAAPLYRLGLPVHCLPIYGQWQHARLDASSDLREPVPASVLLRLSARALATAGVVTDGFGAHSFRRGRAMELLHGGTPREAVSEVLRHRSAASTRPYIADSVRLASLATVMTAATSGRGQPLRHAVRARPAELPLRGVPRADRPLQRSPPGWAAHGGRPHLGALVARGLPPAAAVDGGLAPAGGAARGPGHPPPAAYARGSVAGLPLGPSSWYLAPPAQPVLVPWPGAIGGVPAAAGRGRP